MKARPSSMASTKATVVAMSNPDQRKTSPLREPARRHEGPPEMIFSLHPISPRRCQPARPEDPHPAHRPGHRLRRRLRYRHALYRRRRQGRIPPFHRTTGRPQRPHRFPPYHQPRRAPAAPPLLPGLSDRDVRILQANIDALERSPPAAPCIPPACCPSPPAMSPNSTA